jgi:DNA-binding XRE family transcriptional regulator
LFFGANGMAMASSVTPLKQFRLTLGKGKKGLSQEKMAHKADMSLQTYRNAEAGQDVLLSSAFRIYDAVNAERRARGLAPINFEQLWRSKNYSKSQ